MTISLLMAACNQGNYLRETIASAKEGLAGCRDWEIIVVDDDSTDGCCDGIDEDRVRVIRPGTRIGVSASKHKAGELATGDVLITTDCHCLFPKGSLLQLSESAIQKRAIVEPSVIMEGSHKIQGGGFAMSPRGIRLDRPYKRRQWPAMFGSIYAMSLWVWESTGSWPVLPGYWGCEEQLVSIIAYRIGIPIVVESEIVCTHRQYRAHGKYPYSLPPEDRIRAEHWFHAVCFPRSYPTAWKPLLERKHGSSWALSRDVYTQECLEMQNWLQRRAVLSEEQFFEMIFGSSDAEALIQRKS